MNKDSSKRLLLQKNGMGGSCSCCTKKSPPPEPAPASKPDQLQQEPNGNIDVEGPADSTHLREQQQQQQLEQFDKHEEKLEQQYLNQPAIAREKQRRASVTSPTTRPANPYQQHLEAIENAMVPVPVTIPTLLRVSGEWVPLDGVVLKLSALRDSGILRSSFGDLGLRHSGFLSTSRDESQSSHAFRLSTRGSSGSSPPGPTPPPLNTKQGSLSHFTTSADGVKKASPLPPVSPEEAKEPTKRPQSPLNKAPPAPLPAAAKPTIPLTSARHLASSSPTSKAISPGHGVAPLSPTTKTSPMAATASLDLAAMCQLGKGLRVPAPMAPVIEEELKDYDSKSDVGTEEVGRGQKQSQHGNTPPSILQQSSTNAALGLNNIPPAPKKSAPRSFINETGPKRGKGRGRARGRESHSPGTPPSTPEALTQQLDMSLYDTFNRYDSPPGSVRRASKRKDKKAR